jgi:hypothetical protein
MSLALLLPIPASAAHGSGHVATRKGVARRHCALKPSGRSSSPAGRSSGRVRAAGTCRSTPRARRGTPGATTRFPTSNGPRPLEATPLEGPAGGGAPASAGQAPLPSQSGGNPPASPAGPAGGASTNPPSEAASAPIDPSFLTEVPFGKTSFWIQPWRAYLDTWPTSTLLDSLGINFNVNAAQAEPAAQLLQDSGFKLARVNLSWNALSYSDPTTLRPDIEPAISARLTALHKHGLRPLIVLDANSGAPTPSKLVKLETVEAAPAGAQTVTLTPASAALVVPGRTGFNALAFGGSPDILIASVSPSGVATLSKPLPHPLAAGAHGGSTLLYAPFESPTLANGQPNPTFQATLAGWLNYVATVNRVAAGIVGPEGYDLEVWNELTFGSQFLNAANYYSPGSETSPAQEGPTAESASEESSTEGEYVSSGEGPVAEEGGSASAPVAKKRVTKSVIRALLDETVAYVRDPAHGISPAVGITDGFASESPFPSGANAPIGLTALSKHPYVGERRFPAEYHVNALRPVNALGVQDTKPKEQAPFTPLFVPSYQSLLPEYTLTATSTETLIRDLSPTTTTVYGFPHGRNVGPAGGSPTQKWITEYNLSIGRRATVVGPDGVTPESSVTPTAADREHFHAKALLRSLVAMVSKGISREYFFAAAPGSYSLIGQSFWSALEAHPGTYPGDALGGEVMTGFKNMLAHFQTPATNGPTRQIKLLSITQDGSHAQFTGDGTPAHPSLYDREVLAVFPYQASPTHFVIPVYVMTRNLLTLYQPNAPTNDVTRFDLPNETFHITLGNLPETSTPPTITAYDPLHDQTTPAHLVSHQGDHAEIELAATDYPRLLNIEYTGR